MLMNPLVEIMKLTTLMLLYGLHTHFNFGKIRFINDGRITKILLVLKTLTYERTHLKLLTFYPVLFAGIAPALSQCFYMLCKWAYLLCQMWILICSVNGVYTVQIHRTADDL